MPDVRISVTEEFINKVADQSEFCGSIRKAVSKLFNIDLSGVAVKLEYYAPGCESERPHVTVGVTINQGHRAPQQQELVQALANMVKPIADKAIGEDAGVVKTMIDLGLRKTATAVG
jgi:phenylpyruvate tautomerase PptA (4-oxalocrotonate tautomerase family)